MNIIVIYALKQLHFNFKKDKITKMEQQFKLHYWFQEKQGQIID